jgi:spermidine/putrescine transport system permease protein
MRALLAFFGRPAERLMALIGPALWWLVAFFALPLAIMVVISLAQRGLYGKVEYRWSYGAYEEAAKAAEPPETPTTSGYGKYIVQNYVRAFDPLYLPIYGRSILFAFVTTVFCLLLGYPIAYYIAIKAPERLRGALLMLVVIPFWTSFLVRTYAWILILRSDGVVNHILTALGFQPLPLLYNDFAVLVGLVYGELPFMILPLYSSIQKLDTSLLEAAQDLGATPAQAFWRITMPLTRPGILAGTIFVFIPSIGAFVIPDLMGGSRSIMVGNLIQNQFLFTRDLPFGSAVCFLLTAVVLLALLVNALVAGGEKEAHP